MEDGVSLEGIWREWEVKKRLRGRGQDSVGWEGMRREARRRRRVRAGVRGWRNMVDGG